MSLTRFASIRRGEIEATGVPTRVPTLFFRPDQMSHYENRERSVDFKSALDRGILLSFTFSDRKFKGKLDVRRYESCYTIQSLASFSFVRPPSRNALCVSDHVKHPWERVLTQV